MKVIIEIDKDIILGYTSLMDVKGKEKEKVKVFVEETEYVEAYPSEVEDDQFERVINLACIALILSKFKKHETY